MFALKVEYQNSKSFFKIWKAKKTENFIERFRQKVDGSYVNNRTTKIRLKNSETFKLQEVLLRKRYCAVKSLKRIYFYEALCMNKYSLGGFICTFSFLIFFSITFQSSKFYYSSSSQWQLKWLSQFRCQFRCQFAVPQKR